MMEIEGFMFIIKKVSNNGAKMDRLICKMEEKDLD